jgi:hypothetical protein
MFFPKIFIAISVAGVKYRFLEARCKFGHLLSGELMIILVFLLIP